VKQIDQVKGVKGAYRYVVNVAISAKHTMSPGKTEDGQQHSKRVSLGKAHIKLNVSSH
jgi:hypothetical protein